MPDWKNGSIFKISNNWQLLEMILDMLMNGNDIEPTESG